MRWACILLPHLALDGVLRRCSEPEAPLALVAGTPQRRVLRALNPAARALGLRPGMSLTAAQALSRDFATAEYDPADETCWHRFLAAWAYRFSSQVSMRGANALLIEVGSSLSLFGPWPQFEARLREELAELGFRHRIVAAPNPAAARVLANVHDGLGIVGDEPLRNALGQLPIERSGFAPEVATAFSRMGLRRLRQVMALPRAGVARRFPPEVLQHLDRLLGEQPMPLDWYQPPDVFDERIELGFEVESSQALLFPLRRLTFDLAAFLAGRDGGVQRFVLHLEHEDLTDTQVVIGLLTAERDSALLFEIARSRLEQTQVPAAVRGIRLLAKELPSFVPAHRELFEERPQQAMAWEQLRERLRARLGEQTVHGLRAHADHRPEQAWRGETGEKKSTPASSPSSSARPGWLLPTPIPLLGTVPLILTGPERIETGWWDGGDIRRDYYRVRTRLGQEAWAFRPAGEEGEYMLHGWFA